MRVALVGGTGFVGSYVVDGLLAGGHEPSLLVRPGSEHKVVQSASCRVVAGDVNDTEAIREAISSCDVVVYLIGILREEARNGVTFDALQLQGVERVAGLAVAAGVEHFVLLSANGVSPEGSAYQRTKWQAEHIVAQSGMRSTVLRPSVVFGDPRGRAEFCTQLRDEMIRLPLPAPLFFDRLSIGQAGRFKMSPVHVSDVARVVVGAIEAEHSESETYVLCGPEALEWREIITRIAAALGTRKLALPAPAVAIRAAARLLDKNRWFPITRDQLDMLLAGNTGDSDSVFARFGIEPTPFTSENLEYLHT